MKRPPWLEEVPTAPPTSTPQSTGARILVLDDHAHVRERLDTLLTGHGYTVYPTATGEAAVAVVQALHAQGAQVDLALLDICLPDAQLEGIATARALVPARVRCVMITSMVEAGTRAAATLAGALGYLVKDDASDAVVLATVQAALVGTSLPDPLINVSQRQALLIQQRQQIVQEQWQTLTPAEQAVATLASQGLMNAEIAARRGVDISTIHTQMQEVLAKLRLSGRRALRQDDIYQAHLADE